MGRPDRNQTPSPRMNTNNNPVVQEQEHPVEGKRVVQAEQRYPSNGGTINQPNQQPMMVNLYTSGPTMVTPVPPTYINNGAQINQPYRVSMAGPIQNWTSGLCDCMNDPENAVITFCFPFVTFGQIAEVIDKGATSCGTAGMLYVLIACCFWVPWVYSCSYRTKLRSKYRLMDTPAPDWITHCFCECCALCQEYRELNNRGLNPAIGWIGNVQKQRMGQEMMMTPPMGQRMC